MDKKLQAKNVPEAEILRVLRLRPGKWHTTFDYSGTYDPVKYMASFPKESPILAQFPEKVLRAKLRAMRSRGLVDGCCCGCRGDWHEQGIYEKTNSEKKAEIALQEKFQADETQRGE